MLVFLIVMLCIASYAFVGGAFFAQFMKWRMRECPRCQRKRAARERGRFESEYSYLDSCNADHSFNAGLAAVFWPALMPGTIGFMFGDRDKSKRLQTQREHELEQAKHDSAVAREKRVEAEEVVRQLRALEKTDALKGLLG